MVRFLITTAIFICLGLIPVACSNSNESSDTATDTTVSTETTNNADAEEAVDAQEAVDVVETESADTTTNKE